MRCVIYQTGVEYLGQVCGHHVFYYPSWKTYNVAADEPGKDIRSPGNGGAGYYDPAAILKLKGVPDSEIRAFKKLNRIKLANGKRY